VGEGLTSVDEPSVILAADLARVLHVELGGIVTLLVQTRTGSMDAIDLTVTGLYRFQDPMENKHALVVPLGTAQRLLRMRGRATGYVVAVDRREAIASVAERLRALPATSVPLEVRTWEDVAPYYRDVTRLQDDVLQVVIAIVFVLVVAGVVNTMLMSVFERTREIGTLMAMGFRRRRILALFMIESLTLTALAAAVGAIIGVALVAWANRAGIDFTIPAVGTILNRPVLGPSYVALAIAGAVAGGLAGGLFPAFRASRLRPVEALRSS
jgi:putative ABC transport system permease protein